MSNELTKTESKGIYIDNPFEEFPLKVMGIFKAENGAQIELPWATVEFDPNTGLTFHYTRDILAELPGAQTRVHISNDQELFLYRNKESIPDKSLWKLLHSHLFEFAVQSNYRRVEKEGHLEFDQWILSGDALKGHTAESPSRIRHLNDGDIQLTVGAKTLWSGPVFGINAVMGFAVGYTMKSSTIAGQEILPVPEYEFQYSAPIGLEQVVKHEELFRELLDFVWCRGHGLPVVHLKAGGKRSRLLRKGEHVSNTGETYRALQFDRNLRVKEANKSTSFVQGHLLAWTNTWFSMSDAERRPFIQAGRLLKSPAMQTDLRFASALHCLEALDKKYYSTAESNGKSKGKWLSLNERIHRLSHRWSDSGRPITESTSQYLDRLAYTRNDIIHMECHPECQEGDILEGPQITRAYYEAMTMIRASFLDAMGMPAAIGDEYARAALKELALINYRYS